MIFILVVFSFFCLQNAKKEVTLLSLIKNLENTHFIMKIFTNDGLRRIGDRTLEKENIRMLDLIERAASAVSYELISRWRISKRFVIFAGPGDNGADALAVARMMYEQGYRPEVYLFNIKSPVVRGLSGEPRPPARDRR